MNILFITADQWRGGCTGYAGHPLVRTPNLDALAAEGTAFLDHYAQAAPCSPARACLYTGLYQMTNRVCRNGTPLSDRFDNVARAARRAGYEPTLFGYTDQSADPAGLDPNDPLLTTYEGVLPGFSVRVRLPEDGGPWLSWLAGKGLDLDPEQAHLPVDGTADTDAPRPAYTAGQTQTAFLADEFIRWLGEQQAPWFAHLSFLRPHPPFIVPPPYNAMYSPDEVDGLAGAATAAEEAALHPLVDFTLRTSAARDFLPWLTGLVGELAEHDFRRIRATYYGMIAEVDAQLGRILSAMQAAGQWDDAFVVFTSDHAEMLGDHHLLGKGGFFDESQHVPLIVRDPRQEKRSVHVAAFTEAVDLFPTLLEAMGVKPGHRPDGRSLVPLLTGEIPPDWRDEVHWEYDFRDVSGQSAERWFGLGSTRLGMAAIRTRKWKYVHFTALPPLLFDLENDPENRVDLSDDAAYAPVRLGMAERLLSWRTAHLDQTLALSELTPEGLVSVPG
jgi:arylsulfatase A-like enzyme